MPDSGPSKPRPHPARAGARDSAPRRTPASHGYAELQVTTNFTFLTGGSHPEEFAARAAELGHRAVAVTDRNTLAGIVRAHVAAKSAGLPLVVGSRIELADPAGLSVLVYPTDRAAYGRLCRLLTLGKRRAAKGECRLALADLIEHADGLLAVAVPPAELGDEFQEHLRRLRSVFDGDRLSLALRRGYHQGDEARVRAVAAMGADARVPLVAVNDVHYHVPERRPLQDVLTCIREGTTIDQAGFRLFQNAERHLKPPEEMARLFADHPAAVARTVEIAERAAGVRGGGFTLDQIRYDYPEEVVPPGKTPSEHLAALTWAGAAWRYPRGVPPGVRAQIEHELRLIDELKYAPYFLTVHDIVAFGVSRGILCQGRGAAANSAVCYALGVTAVDPDRVSVLFERFISRERDEPPDIDIDFEHERREEVIQYLYAKYGRERAALTAEVISYRGRSAIREVGKAMGLSLDAVDRLAKDTDWWNEATGPARLRELGLDPGDARLAAAIALAGELKGFPRHLSQHVGGFVLTRSPLCELVPIENAAMEDRTIVEWDKDDLDAMGMLKVDVLGLGMLTCIRKSFELVERHGGGGGGGRGPLTLATIPPEDPAVYDMLCAADSVGVFQVESRAQMSMLPRLRPRCYYDLVIEVAIVRPGPIQGDMVHPYLRRRCGEEPVTYASPDIERVLGRTLGVPLFQEQAMALAVVAAGFTPGEADQLRRAMAAWGRSGDAIRRFEGKLIDGMVARGYAEEFARRCSDMIRGFSGYGFPESHAASFALLVYASAWLKLRHPAAFAAALLNSQPMGFYQPAQIVRDAQAHGVEVRPVDANRSTWDCTLEPGDRGPTLRLGMRLVQGLGKPDADRIAAAVAAHAPFGSLRTLWRCSGVRVAPLRRLAEADAFASMGLPRRAALWALQAMRDEPLPLFESVDAAERTSEPHAELPAAEPPAEVREDYRATGLSLKAHPVAFVRADLAARGVIPNRELADPAACPQGRRVRVAGLVLVRQRPGTASGILFMTLEDETGVANLIVRPKVYERCRRAARHASAVICEGVVERRGEVVHVLTRAVRDMGGAQPSAGSRDFH